MKLWDSAQSKHNMRKKLEQFIGGGDSGVSPTGQKLAYECQLSYLLSSVLQVFQKEDNIHFQYGNAYGAACAKIVILHGSKPKDVVLGAAYAAAIAYMPIDADYKGKNWYSLLSHLDAFYTYWVYQYDAGWRGVSTEEKTVIYLTGSDRDVGNKLSGTYDLKLTNMNTGMFKIVDLKTTGSDFYYNWSTDTQVLYYTLLCAIQDWVNGTKAEYAAGEYWVAITQEQELEFKVVTLASEFCSELVNPMLLHALRTDSAIRRWAKHAMKAEYSDVAFSGVERNPKACKRGNFTCSFNPLCNEGAAVFVGDVPDLRKPTNTTTIYLAMSDMLHVVSKLEKQYAAQRPAAIEIVDAFDCNFSEEDF